LREIWQGKVAERMTTLPLDTSSLFGELADPASQRFEGLPAETVMGHVHLCVADIPHTVAFCRDVLGFALMASVGGRAAFLSAGGYHHHLGANTWESAGAGQPPTGLAALRRATILLPGEAEHDRLAAQLADAGHEIEQLDDRLLVRDPCGNPIVLAVG
jgi:catechol 2,3-dioxygenase